MAKKKAAARKPKPPAAISPAAIEQTMLWLVEGHHANQISEGLADEFKLPADQARATIAAASAKIERLAEDGIPSAWLLQATREVYRRAMEASELGTALRALEKMERIAQELDEDENDL